MSVGLRRVLVFLSDNNFCRDEGDEDMDYSPGFCPLRPRKTIALLDFTYLDLRVFSAKNNAYIEAWMLMYCHR